MAKEMGILRPIEGNTFHRDLTLSNHELDSFQLGMDADSFLNHVGLNQEEVAVIRENFRLFRKK
ncbi:hypothetical protein [Peribacillus glennii]|uniref:Uncharacterized protein n=1 Tax=Peribacillus glennii TaxID=2303991 RepID=A0A372LBN8_9BACI|nr:hypothetical protein [Peribacillus glennii]RFU62870.1 hypothetical protein D0466_13030 [Peribacillus glennii]